jgi:metal-responsive CopG/Arc/MetJ family transcriptional regulator
MKNVQVTIDDETLARVDHVGRPLGLSRSEIVRQALRGWLRQRAVDGFEREWISALERRPDEASRAEAWRDIQAWGRK